MIGFVNSKTNESSKDLKLNYHFFDQHPMIGENLYRLKIIHQNGNIQYSAIKTLTNTSIQQHSIYPNPVDEFLTIDGLSEGLSVKIIDLTGRIFSNNITTSNTLKLNVNYLKSGIYQIQISQKEGQRSHYKFIKK